MCGGEGGVKCGGRGVQCGGVKCVGGEGCSLGADVVVGNDTGMFLITHYSTRLSNHCMQNRLSSHTDVL